MDAQNPAIRPTAAQMAPAAALRSQHDRKMAEFVRRNHAIPVGVSGFDRRTFGLTPSPRRIPIQSIPILPAAILPSSPKVGHLVEPAKRVTVEAEYVAPPIRGADLGGILVSTSPISGNIGVHPGRAFGAEAHLFI